MEKSTTHFVLLIDADREHCLNILMQAFVNDPSAVKYIARRGLQQTMESLMEEIGDKTHELGWCTDPNCEEKNV